MYWPLVQEHFSRLAATFPCQRKKTRMITRLRISFLLALCMALLSTACAHKRFYTFNLRFSYNIARLEKDWPGDPKKKLTLAQQEIFEKRGAPDMIRFWWNGSGQLSARV